MKINIAMLNFCHAKWFQIVQPWFQELCVNSYFAFTDFFMRLLTVSSYISFTLHNYESPKSKIGRDIFLLIYILWKLGSFSRIIGWLSIKKKTIIIWSQCVVWSVEVNAATHCCSLLIRFSLTRGISLIKC